MSVAMPDSKNYGFQNNNVSTTNKRNKDFKSDEEIKKIISDRIDEIYTKLKNGEVEPSYIIGAQSFTQKEWDRLLEKFDNVEDTIKKEIEEEIEKKDEKKEKDIIDKKYLLRKEKWEDFLAGKTDNI